MEILGNQSRHHVHHRIRAAGRRERVGKEEVEEGEERAITTIALIAAITITIITIMTIGSTIITLIAAPKVVQQVARHEII